MEYHIPKQINCDDDLQKYENYIQKYEQQPKTFSAKSCHTVPEESSKNITMCLKNHIGKLVKVETLIDNRLDIRIGTIIEIGCDHIVLKLHSCCCSLVIPMHSIKYITIAHDNNLRKMLNR